MRSLAKFFQFILLTSVYLVTLRANAQENAAPSIHLTSRFPSGDAILKMQKIKITKSAMASYFEVNSFIHGYAGLQQTPDKSYGHPNILISSLWDPNTSRRIYSSVVYHDSTTFKSRFGGEGEGYKTINPYNWSLNTWYNLVNRGWKSGGRLYIGTFINDLSSGRWFHTATLSIPDPGKYLMGYNDAFLENWDGKNASWDGSWVREAFFKDGWILTVDGKWEKNTSVSFSANDSPADKKRNGIYHNSFNAYFDSTADAYCMQHGGKISPSPAFANQRILKLPLQVNQGETPTLPTSAITSFDVIYKKGITKVQWAIDELQAPQLSVQIEILDISGKVVKSIQNTLPQRRSYDIRGELNNGNYTVQLTVTDIFNQVSKPAIAKLKVPGN